VHQTKLAIGYRADHSNLSLCPKLLFIHYTHMDEIHVKAKKAHEGAYLERRSANTH
jgi:hypothetical protein